MKTILILCLLGVMVTAAEPAYPSSVGWVNDFANVISADDGRQMSNLIQELKDKTKAEIAVATVPTIGEEVIETYAVRLFERWKIGEKGKDTGVLILLAIKERKVKVEVGYGLEGVIPDGLAGQIIDQTMLPYFKTGDFSSGLKNGTMEVVRIIAKEYNVEIEGALNVNRKIGDQKTGFFEFLFLLIFGIFFFIGSMRRRYFYSGTGGYRGGGFSGGGFSGGFGGGFGGFGGGFSGGGGASRGF